MKRESATFIILFVISLATFGQGDGFIIKDGIRLFPLGCYSMPEEDNKLKELADAGFNLIGCNSKETLDRAHAVGLKAWLPLNLQDGVTDEFKDLVNAVVDHPALVLWEGPDEVVWNFQAYSGLYLKYKVHEKPGAWWEQTPGAVRYAKEQADIIIPNMIAAISYIRSVDTHNRQVWINEACRSDVGYVRQYLDFIDITGCDYYPISSLLDPERSGVPRGSVDKIRYYTKRWMEIGKGKPVYMVLQAFSWADLGGRYSESPPAFPSFDESRYMAYISIAYGASGINYWGTHSLKDEEFRQSLFAVISELSSLQPFLVSRQDHVSVKIITDSPEQQDPIASCFAGRSGHDWMIAVINETDNYQMGVVVENLRHLNGIKLFELYGDEEVTVSNEEIVLRMKPREVKVFASDKKWETKRVRGRDYMGR